MSHASESSEASKFFPLVRDQASHSRVCHYVVQEHLRESSSHRKDLLSAPTSPPTTLNPQSPTPSSLTKPIKQRPRQHKTHQPPKHIPQPQIPHGTEEKSLGFGIGLERENQSRDDSRAEEVEDEAGKGLQAESAGRDAEEGGG